MALCCQMDDTINVLVLHQLIERIEVADVHLLELVVGLILDVLEVGEIASISELIEVDDVVFGVFVHEEAYYMRADEACTSSYNYISFHNFMFMGKRLRAKDESHLPIGFLPLFKYSINL